MFWKDPYLACLSAFAKCAKRDLPVPELRKDSIPSNHEPPRRSEAPCALLLTPHPDDECLTGALPLRLRQEAGWQVVNVAITLGSKAERRQERWDELGRACRLLEFDVMQAVPEGFATVRGEVRETQPKIWEKMAQRVAEIVNRYKPQAVFLPHRHDGHMTHTGTHLLAMDALAHMSKDFACHLVQTEYWQQQPTPNCMIGMEERTAARLLKALCCHAGEVARNPYHKLFPAFLLDNVRRGSERVGGQGAKGDSFDFAMLYRHDRWENGQIAVNSNGRAIVGPDESVLDVFRDCGMAPPAP
jgi:LmbE family N-acetylglucosaminyl deacetylase